MDLDPSNRRILPRARVAGSRATGTRAEPLDTPHPDPCPIPRHRCHPGQGRRRADRRDRRRGAAVRRRGARRRRPLAGSHARHRRRARRARHPGRRPRQGRGAAARDSTRPRPSIVVFIDADGSHDPHGHPEAGRADPGRPGRSRHRLARQRRQRRAARHARAVHPLRRLAAHHARDQLPLERPADRQPERLPRDSPRRRRASSA